VRNTTHQIVGVTCALGASRALGLEAVETAAASVNAVWGSWLPDADRLGTRIHRRSRAERRSPLVGALGAVARLPLWAFALVARHRGISHSPEACVLVCAAAAALGLSLPPPALALTGGLALGYVTHVAADACTPFGVSSALAHRKLWLVPRRARIRTGSLREALVAASSAALSVGLLALAY
jgi:membrane-bound metal-dependent hydrolase YbcI (DUF457 family)